ncbi:hypothetical protein LIER_41726 [Lithospermum erythrorhizon]|uniref:Uncharacterized protein n=1 Tax=Lithospermum erythrorhizon TaxID=34254 RepID=A0AAV3RF30_LITER
MTRPKLIKKPNSLFNSLDNQILRLKTPKIVEGYFIGQNCLKNTRIGTLVGTSPSPDPSPELFLKSLDSIGTSVGTRPNLLVEVPIKFRKKSQSPRQTPTYHIGISVGTWPSPDPLETTTVNQIQGTFPTNLYPYLNPPHIS